MNFPRLSIPFSISLTLFAAAVPALARPSADARAIDAHYASLETPETGACFEFDTRDAASRQMQCEKALDQLARARDAKRNPSVGEQANFDYREVTINAGLAAAYAEQDKSLSQRGCALMERNVALRAQLKTLRQSDLSQSGYETYQNPPENFMRVVEICRKAYGKPKS